MRLTDKGMRLKRRAEDIVSLARATEAELRQGQELSGTIAIGTGGFASSRLLATAIEAFHQKHPQVRFDFYVNSTEYVQERLEAGLLDFGVMMGAYDRRRFSGIDTGVQERWGLLMRSGDPLASQHAINSDDLCGSPIMTTAHTDLQEVLGQWAGRDLDRLDVVCTYNVVTNVAELVGHGVARALTIEGAVSMLDPSRFAFRPLEPELALRTCLVWRKSNGDSSLASTFLNLVKSMLGKQSNI